MSVRHSDMELSLLYIYKSHKHDCLGLTLQDNAAHVLLHVSQHVSGLSAEVLLFTIMAQGQLFPPDIAHNNL